MPLAISHFLARFPNWHSRYLARGISHVAVNPNGLPVAAAYAGQPEEIAALAGDAREVGGAVVDLRALAMEAA